MTVLIFTLIDTSGVSHVLDINALGIDVAPGAKNLGMPTIAVNSNKLAYAPGGALTRVSTPPTEVDIPLFAQRSTAALLEQLLDDLTGWVHPGTERDATPKTIRFQALSSDGTSRELEGVCTGGLDDSDTLEAMGTTWQDLVLSLTCVDPYPRDASATVYTFTSGLGIRSWWPYWPYDLTPSAVFAQEVITNSGQIEAWPIWTITGPGSDPTLTNLTTGEVLALSGLTLAAGDVVTIDTSEGVKTILNQNGVNLWPYATLASEMWPLGVGTNSIRVQMAGATGSSAVALSYRRRWSRLRRR